MRFTLTPEGKGARLVLDHDAYPEGKSPMYPTWHEHLSANWPLFYFQPFAKYLARALKGGNDCNGPSKCHSQPQRQRAGEPAADAACGHRPMNTFGYRCNERGKARKYVGFILSLSGVSFGLQKWRS